MVKDEHILLSELLPIWKEYPIDKFVFYDDNSKDTTVSVIKYHLGNRAIILNDNLANFNESHNRSSILEYSRKEGATHVISIDCDELLSDNLVKNFNKVMAVYDRNDMQLYQYNVVNGTLQETRNDPMYAHNFRSFILPLKNTGRFNLDLWKYHTPRTPNVNLPPLQTREVGMIHLQATNKRFYALKQLWYKHYELKNYNYSCEEINRKYDPVINNLNFMSTRTPSNIIGDIKFDHTVYDEVCKQKQYLEFIHENYNKDLITFGEEYI